MNIFFSSFHREYAEEIESRLSSHGIITSIILLREDYTLIEAIDNATRLHCLYGIIVMPMHEERQTASFHILHGETEGSHTQYRVTISHARKIKEEFSPVNQSPWIQPHY